MKTSNERAAAALAVEYDTQALRTLLDKLEQKAIAAREAREGGDPGAWEVGSAGIWYYLSDDDRERAHHVQLALQIKDRADRAGARERILERRRRRGKIAT